jgi:beta-glucosidase
VTYTGRLLFPALRWQPATGFAHERATIDAALALGAGGFVIFGGDADAVRELTRDLRERSSVPLLIASDLERGAGQQFPQATPLPPLAAIGSLNDLDVTRRAGALTAREALAVGVNWLYAPDADIDLEPRNPIVGSRAFGTDAQHVAEHVVAWIEGAHAEGALCCAKHFPGHGRTTEDSHATLPRVTASRDELDVDLQPFRAAIAAEVDSLMTAHVIYDALDASTAATLSHPILQTLLRDELKYDGLVVSDAIIMEGMLMAGGGSEAGAAITAVNAGCDALLYPSDVATVGKALEAALGKDLDRARTDSALARIDAACQRARTHTDGSWGAAADRAWADDIAQRCCTVVRGKPAIGRSIDLLTIDDDVGGPYPAPPRDAFVTALRDAGVEVDEAAETASVIAIYSDIRAWKGAPGLSNVATLALEAALHGAPTATIIFFGHARLARDLPGNSAILCAWGGEPIMQRAAARWLTRTG